MSKDPYQILKVHPSAKLEEIKKAYRKLVKIHHPDKGGDSAVMLEVNSAWEILKKKHKDLNLDKVNNSKLYNIGNIDSNLLKIKKRKQINVIA